VKKRFGRANRNDGSRAWRSTSSIAEVRTAIEYEYRFAEYRFAEYEYDEKIVYPAANGEEVAILHSYRAQHRDDAYEGARLDRYCERIILPTSARSGSVKRVVRWLR
jgi:hypothetical protein